MEAENSNSELQPFEDSAETTKHPVPVCPYCGTDPMMITASNIMLANPQGGPPVPAMMIFCGTATCRAMFNISVLAQVSVQQRPPLVQVPKQKIVLSS